MARMLCSFSLSPLICYIHLQVVSKHPLEANLSGNSLERVPKYLFLNYYLVALNLSRNYMKVCTTYTIGGWVITS